MLYIMRSLEKRDCFGHDYLTLSDMCFMQQQQVQCPQVGMSDHVLIHVRWPRIDSKLPRWDWLPTAYLRGMGGGVEEDDLADAAEKGDVRVNDPGFPHIYPNYYPCVSSRLVDHV